MNEIMYANVTDSVVAPNADGSILAAINTPKNIHMVPTTQNPIALQLAMKEFIESLRYKFNYYFKNLNNIIMTTITITMPAAPIQ